MNIILSKLVSIIIAPVLFVTGLFGVTPDKYEANLGATIPTSIALFETSLYNSITSDATSMTLVSATTKDGTTLATSTYAFIIDEGTASEEFVTATCVSTVCTSMTRGISAITGTNSIESLKKSHRRGASVKITDAPQLLILSRIVNGDETIPNILKYASNPTFTASTSLIDKNYVDILSSTKDALYVKLAGDQTINGIKTFVSSPIVPTPTTDYQASTKLYADGKVSLTGNETVAGVKTFSSLPKVPITPVANEDVASKEYVDSITLAGGSVANNTTTGIVRVASSTQIASGYSSTTAYAIPSSLASSTSSTGSIVISTLAGTGKLDTSFISNTSAYGFSTTTTFGAIAIGIGPKINTYNASTTWSKPAGLKYAIIQVWGAGGSGSRPTGGGGAGGSYIEKRLSESELGATEAVVIGTGGSSVVGNANGNNGGSSSFGSKLVAYGGGGGKANGSGGGGGGTLSAGAIEVPGTPNAGTGGGATFGGASPGAESSSNGGAGGATIYGGGGGGGSNNDGSGNGGTGGASVYGGAGGGGSAGGSSGTKGAGGASVFGGAGGAGEQQATVAENGSIPGGGGGGSGGGNSGAGGNGRVIVTEYYF